MYPEGVQKLKNIVSLLTEQFNPFSSTACQLLADVLSFPFSAKAQQPGA